MKRNVKFYRRDKSVKYRGTRFRGRNGKYRYRYHYAWMYGYWFYPYTGKQRRTLEKAQLVKYLQTGDDECFYPIRGGDEDWS